jgi:hypothetical protein
LRVLPGESARWARSNRSPRFSPAQISSGGTRVQGEGNPTSTPGLHK